MCCVCDSYQEGPFCFLISSSPIKRTPISVKMLGINFALLSLRLPVFDDNLYLSVVTITEVIVGVMPHFAFWQPVEQLKRNIFDLALHLEKLSIIRSFLLLLFKLEDGVVEQGTKGVVEEFTDGHFVHVIFLLNQLDHVFKHLSVPTTFHNLLILFMYFVHFSFLFCVEFDFFFEKFVLFRLIFGL